MELTRVVEGYPAAPNQCSNHEGGSDVSHHSVSLRMIGFAAILAARAWAQELRGPRRAPSKVY